MSAQYFNVYIQPKDRAAHKVICDFVGAVNSENFRQIQAMKYSELLDDIEHQLSGGIDQTENDGVINLVFETPTSFETESIFEFLVNHGAREIEGSVYFSQSGNYLYYKGTEATEDFDISSWKWLQNPDEEELENEAPIKCQTTRPKGASGILWEAVTGFSNMQELLESVTQDSFIGLALSDLRQYLLEIKSDSEYLLETPAVEVKIQAEWARSLRVTNAGRCSIDLDRVVQHFKEQELEDYSEEDRRNFPICKNQYVWLICSDNWLLQVYTKYGGKTEADDNGIIIEYRPVWQIVNKLDQKPMEKVVQYAQDNMEDGYFDMRYEITKTLEYIETAADEGDEVAKTFLEKLRQARQQQQKPFQ